VEDVRPAVDEDSPWLLPLEGLLKQFFPEPWCEGIGPVSAGILGGQVPEVRVPWPNTESYSSV
jgi:hypothetical protein